MQSPSVQRLRWRLACEDRFDLQIPHVYNTVEQVDRVLGVVREIV